MFDGFFGYILGAIGQMPLYAVPSEVQFWLSRFGIDLVIGGFITGVVSAITVIGARTAINLFTLGVVRL